MVADKSYKEAWMKLTGPAAETLGEVFFKSHVVVWPDFNAKEKGEKDFTGQEENDTNRKQPGEHFVKVGVYDAATSPRQGAEEVKPKTEPPTKIIIAKAGGAKKCIKVLRTCRIVLLGQTGVGKSSLGNKIFEENVFNSGKTSKTQVHSKSVGDRRITVFDTPGFSGRDQPEEGEIGRRTTGCTPGPHVFLIVIKVEKFSEQQVFIDKIRQYFPEEAFKYAAVVFTHGDQLQNKDVIKQKIKQNRSLNDLVNRCGSRYHVVDNKYNRAGEETSPLLNTIDEMVKNNKGGCYTKKSLRAPKGEDDYTTKGNLSGSKKKMWIKLSGPAGKSVAEAFFGLSVAKWHEAQEAPEDRGVAKDEKEGENAGGAADKTKASLNAEQQTVAAPSGGERSDKTDKPEIETEQGGESLTAEAVLDTIAPFVTAALGLLATVGIMSASAFVKLILLTASAVKSGITGEGGTEGAAVRGEWLKEKLDQLTHLYNTIKQNLGVILLVFAFYLLLVFSFCNSVPMAGTFLLSGGVLVMFLLVMFLLTAIMQQH